MTTLKFKCILHSDIVLSELAATEGIQRTLDYIPGNVFLGIVAGKVYPEIEKPGNDNKKEGLKLTMDLFHNANVRFGDAFPLIGSKRAIKVPASWFVKKGETIKDQVYIYHQLTDEQKRTEPMAQLRDKFIVRESETQFSEVKLGKSFAIKSAYDSANRRSMDQQMYGYQSLEAGMELGFQVDFDDEVTIDLKNKVKTNLIGKRNIGRSKTAQYGQVEIFDNSAFDIGCLENQEIESGYTYLYAESRLLFIDEENGQPIIPTDGKYYKMNGATVDLERSQIRTFRYSPYNYKRQSRDADRFGIEKGSVICINRNITPKEQPAIKQGLGYFLNEGFGKVLINPEFLAFTENGEAKFKHIKYDNHDSNADSKSSPDNNLGFNQESDLNVWQYLIQQQGKKANQQLIYSAVNKFVADHQKQFESESFASQWGTIRSIASRTKEYHQLWKSLFREKNEEEIKNKVKVDEGYLVHGVAKDKWSERGRLDSLKSFVESIEPKELVSEAVVNLAAEMAKKCGRK